jgi:putative GTP pyrophosphokinase
MTSKISRPRASSHTFPSTVDDLDGLVREQFEILEATDKAEQLIQEDRFGYQSVHYIVRLKADRTALPEYRRFEGLVGEIQVRTILQHAWAEIEHDIQYKSIEASPTGIRRRFGALAGLLELADREFQSIQQEDAKLRAAARRSVDEGELARVEITADALKTYLDKRLGPDARMSSWSYDWVARRIRRLGFSSIAQVDELLAGFDDDRISRVIWGSRQGQLSRFEDTVLAAMGEELIRRNPLGVYKYRLEKLRKAGIPVGARAPGG